MIPALVPDTTAALPAPPPNRRERLSVPATWRSSTAADSMAASLMR